MTLPQADLQAAVNKMVKRNPRLSEEKLSQRLNNLERMRQFYLAKAPDAPVKQATTFYSFAATLKYAEHIIILYKFVTYDLENLKENEDEIGTNS